MMICDALAYYYLRNPLPMRCPRPKPMVPPPWKVEVLASDMSYSGLVTAQQGVVQRGAHGTRGLHLPPSLFRPARDKYVVKPALKSLVQFDFHNLKADFLPRRNDNHFLPERHDLFR